MRRPDRIKRALKAFALSPEYQQLVEHGKIGGKWLMLAYCTETRAEPIEMGFVCKTAGNQFWWMTTNPKIQCGVSLYTEQRYYDDQEAALTDLTAYVLKEAVRMFDLTKPVFTHELEPITLRKSDKKACALTGSDPDSFLAGMDWAIRTHGLPRRPLWAKFLVQNLDNSLTWFEYQPKPNAHKGLWESDETDGRSLMVFICKERKKHPHVWMKSIRRVK